MLKRADPPATAVKRAAAAVLLLVTGSGLVGCWTPPVANVQPQGEARLIQSAIPVVAVKDGATVQSTDQDHGTISLSFPAGTNSTVKAGPGVKNLRDIRAGDRVRATVTQQLSVYVLKNGQLAGANGTAETVKSDARVLMIEPSYRLLTLQYPNRKVETFKVGLEAKLTEMEPGDDVVIETTEVLAVRVRKP